jgi:glycerol-3-phosphate acyltransferase PlsY
VYPLAAIGCLIVFSVCLAISRYVSLSSILMVLTFMITALVANNLGYLDIAGERMMEFDILVICFTALAIWRHRANIVRLIHGNENKLSIGKSK